jgi:DNA-directed RNA polymerase subunit beta
MAQLRKNFGKIAKSLTIPHLLNLQIDSYDLFLQQNVPPASRADAGLEGVFRSVFPIEDFNKTASLEYVSYEIGEPKYDMPECIAKGLTYEAPLRIKVRLVVYDVDEETENRTIRDIKEQIIYFGTVPLMTEKGTFIINGTERVIVNQLQRSPGIIFEHDSGKTHTSRKVLYSCRIIPMRGSWLDFDYDHKDILYVRIDRRRKMPATILFKAMGMSSTDILRYFYAVEYFRLEGDRAFREINPEMYRKEKAYATVMGPDGKPIVTADKPITKKAWRLMVEGGVEAIEVDPATLSGLFLAEDMADPGTGEVIAAAGDEVTPDLTEKLKDAGLTRLPILFTRGVDTSSSIRDTLALDKTTDTVSAQVEIYRRLRPSSPPTQEIAASFFENLFRTGLLALSPVGRYKINVRLKLDLSLDFRVSPTRTSALGQAPDPYKDSRDRPTTSTTGQSPGPSLGEWSRTVRIGLVRMERAIKERRDCSEGPR